MAKAKPSASVRNQRIATSGVFPHLCQYKRLMVDGFTSSGSKSAENRSLAVTVEKVTSVNANELEPIAKPKKSKFFESSARGSSKDPFFIVTGICDASENGWFFAFQRNSAVPFGIHVAHATVTLSKTVSALNMNANTPLQEAEVTATPAGEVENSPSCGRSMADGSEIACCSAFSWALATKSPDSAKANTARYFTIGFMGFPFTLSNFSTSRASRWLPIRRSNGSFCLR